EEETPSKVTPAAARRGPLRVPYVRRGHRDPARPLAGRRPILRRGLPGVLPPEPHSRRVRRRLGRAPRLGGGGV
ncbi:MAG: hypothetical protein AVDCRST_MAG64-4391, partial [uncultured Phycisphaerae bacterium]